MPKATHNTFINNKATSESEDRYLDDKIDELNASGDKSMNQTHVLQPLSMRKDIFMNIYCHFALQPVLTELKDETPQVQSVETKELIEVDVAEVVTVPKPKSNQDCIVKSLLKQWDLFINDKLDSDTFFDLINCEAKEYPLLWDAWIKYVGSLDEWLVTSEGFCSEPPYYECTSAGNNNVLESTEFYNLIHEETKDFLLITSNWIKHVGALGEWMEKEEGFCSEPPAYTNASNTLSAMGQPSSDLISSGASIDPQAIIIYENQGHNISLYISRENNSMPGQFVHTSAIENQPSQPKLIEKPSTILTILTSAAICNVSKELATGNISMDEEDLLETILTASQTVKNEFNFCIY
ncbi:hypothetical protein Moror_5127 [Moniliophthora roreri MCA 2997]|uniref:Uncharacterized protein n=1 Tax=Moniliophthora roreri (strain MCA 2997) TaxID=1381753 RepID=V2WJF9_MONRO|nr:hypothetical protein Moror_5127 [Moniliophthora roreri MCA 2997]